LRVRYIQTPIRFPIRAILRLSSLTSCLQGLR
jgi:hypothetical protein